MNAAMTRLARALKKIDRPGSFCTSGDVPVVLPGLEVAGLGPVAMPLSAAQAGELKKHCAQAPFGKGTETVVDTKVRRVWKLDPDRFTLNNPDWQKLVGELVVRVQTGLGLEGQKLTSHLYDLLLYEKGGFFLPHQDGEKLPGMVATLVVVLPSAHEGGELVVRHEGREQTIAFASADANTFRVHYAAFYADCEHEVRPLTKGHRLCLVYNLTLARGKKPLTAPRLGEQTAELADALRGWAADPDSKKLALPLSHQYTQAGLTWDGLKGVDRAQAGALAAAAKLADCRVYLALLTLHESGAADEEEYGYEEYEGEEYDGEEEEAGGHKMGEVYDTSLSADHWTSADGGSLPIGEMPVAEEEVLASKALKSVTPEEEFEGYTGNEGMTLERWYRHGAIFVWPERRHFQVLCDCGSSNVLPALEQLVGDRLQASGARATALKVQCAAFASAVVSGWRGTGDAAESQRLLDTLMALDDPESVRPFFQHVVADEQSGDLSASLPAVCEKYGWATFGPELATVFDRTSTRLINRNVRVLESLCLAKSRRKGRLELCQTLADRAVAAVERVDTEPGAQGWYARNADRTPVLAGMTRSLILAGRHEGLARFLSHARAQSELYPLAVQIAALLELQPWLARHLAAPCEPLSQWAAACRQQLEALAGQEPTAPADFRRDARVSCKCANCAVLRKFLEDPQQKEHRFRMVQEQRKHLEYQIRGSNCDLDTFTDRKGSPQTLVCTKNTASFQVRLKKYQDDLVHLSAVRAVEAALPR